MATIQIQRQPNNYTHFDPWTAAYSKLICVAERQNASGLQSGYKYRVRVVVNNVQVAEIQQPANPDGKLYFDMAPYIKSYVNTDETIGNIQSFNNIIQHRLTGWAAEFQLYISGIIGQTQVDPEVSTTGDMAYNGSTGLAFPEDRPFDILTWYTNNQLPPNCVDCLPNWTNAGLLTWQPNWITKSMDPTMWFAADSDFEVPQVDLYRRGGSIVPMYVQQWSSPGQYPFDTNRSIPLRGLFSFQVRYYNKTTLIGTNWISNSTQMGWGPQTSCGPSTASALPGNVDIPGDYSALSMGYQYYGFGNELNATHVWITAHSYADPQACNRPWSGNQLNCWDSASIAEFSGLVPIAAYRVNFIDTCDSNYQDLPSSREKPGQLIFMNSLGGWDVINLKNVKVTYSNKKSMWRNENLNDNGSWYDTRNHVNDTESTITFSCSTDYMNDYSETFIRQAFASPAAYLLTQMPFDNVYPGVSGDELSMATIKGVITTQSVTPKRRATDKLYQYNFEFLADAKYKTQRS
jgi:hypothetical protein